MSNEMNQQPRKRGPMGRMGRDFYCYDLCRMLNGVQRCRTKDSRKSYDRTVRGTDGKDPGHRKH